MKFLCLAYEEERVFDRMTREQWETLRRETLDYVQSLRDSGRLISAEPLRSSSEGRTVRVREGRIWATDGPFAETKEQLGGFFLIEAADLDEAVSIASGWPSARLGSIEVRPVEDGLREEGRYAPV